MTRAETKALTRERIIGQARRLFAERGYAATSLEQIADAAGVTKGAIYGHFTSKEDLMVTAIEADPTPDFGTALSKALAREDLAPESGVLPVPGTGLPPVHQRMTEFSHVLAADEELADTAALAAHLEFLAALIRNPDIRRRYIASRNRRLSELAAADPGQPVPGITREQVWAIGHALLVGLQLDRALSPETFTPDVFARALALLTGLYPGE